MLTAFEFSFFGREVQDSEDMANDAEGVWSLDVEQSFLEAVAIHPHCGKAKILGDDGNLYGKSK